MRINIPLVLVIICCIALVVWAIVLPEYRRFKITKTQNKVTIAAHSLGAGGASLVEYYLTHGRIPKKPDDNKTTIPNDLTAPVLYRNKIDEERRVHRDLSMLVDPFRKGDLKIAVSSHVFTGSNPEYISDPIRFGVFISYGPDRKQDIYPQLISNIYNHCDLIIYLTSISYDPTNGIASQGDMFSGIYLDNEKKAYRFDYHGVSPIISESQYK